MSEPLRTFNAGRHFQFFSGLVLAGLFLIIAFANVDMPELGRVLASVDLRYLPLILLLLALSFLAKALRWAYILKPLRNLSMVQVFPALMIGFAGNNVLPAHLGEFVRMFVLARQYGLPMTQVLTSIVIERLLDFVAVVALLALSLQFTPVSAELRILRAGGYVIGAVCLFLLSVMLAAAWKPGRARGIITRLRRFFPSAARDRLVRLGNLAVEGLGSLRRPGLLSFIVLLTLVAWLLNGFCLYLCVVSFPMPRGPSPVAGFLVASVTALGVTLPSAPGYIGTTQLCFVIALGAFNVDKTTALSGSVYAFLTAYIPVTLAGLIFAWRLGVSFRSLKWTAREETNEDDTGGRSAEAGEIPGQVEPYPRK